MSKASEGAGYLDSNLVGPILRVEDPRNYSTDDIIKSYYREIVLIAGKFTRHNIAREDLVQEGIIGLLDAIKRWDPEKAKGNPRNFHNLAIIRIKSAMYTFFLANGGRYRFPSYMARGLIYLKQIRRLIEETHFQGDVEEVLGVLTCPDFEAWASPEAVRRVSRAKQRLSDLARSVNNDYETLVQRILETENNIQGFERESAEAIHDPEEQAANKEFVETLLQTLNPETREIISMSLEGMTLEEIGEIQGKTRQRIQQIRQKFLDILRQTRMFKGAFED